MTTETRHGKVYLIGAGPGDPGLITVKGAACIHKADVVIYDYLASKALLKYAAEAAELIYVGKKGGDHTMAQEDINALIVEKALAGRCVARLKGGDPFVFGRGGEEVEALIPHRIPFEVVPGVTSAVAAPAYAGIPLTHRKLTSTVAFITGHEDPTKTESSIDYAALVKGIGTLVFFMGIKRLPLIVERLLANGKPPETPVALVRWGTTTRQFTVTGTLADIVETANRAGMKAPALIIVGEVVTLREEMKWFEARPLMGKRIVVTRAREQASDLVNALGELGAHCIECPTIRIVEPENWAPLDEAVDRIGEYQWLVFTSVNGVRFFFRRLFEKGKDVRALAKVRTAVIGPATHDALRAFGIRADIVPRTYRAESIVEAFTGVEVSGQKVLLPRAREARSVLPVELRKMGAQVDEVQAYRTEADRDGAATLLTRLEENRIDLVTFTSSSTVKNFHALLPEDRFPALMRDVTVASIGPITTETAEALGFTVHVTADEYTIPGLCDAIRRHAETQAI